ncbi:MAG: Uma2 family endonuclease [Gemmataceae bacterium]|nr:Uma2 family endonuclease [Gemmataceae bacterium]
MSAPVRPPGSLEDPFRYGWRYVRHPRPDGTAETEMVPLTLLDVLHPQEGDHIPENSWHEQHRRHFHDVVRQRLARRPTLLSLSDCLIDWDRPDLRGHSPDLILLERDEPWPWRHWSTLHVKHERSRPLLVVELTSPSTRVNDLVDKVDHYHRAGVPLYVIVDQQEEGGPLELIAYRHQPQGYVRLSLDERGRLPLEVLGLELALFGDRVALFDAQTGEELGDYTEVCETLEAEVKARLAAEQKCAEAERREREQVEAREIAEQARQLEEEARQAAEQARVEAEQRERTQTEARRQAEQARADAERRERDQTEAREAAEQRERQEAEARRAVEARLQEMEAELQRLRGA